MGKIVLMIVDKQPFLRTELRKAIKRASSAESIEIFECDPGLDGNEVVAQIDDILPDVVLLDINYPHLDGLLLCRKIVRNTPQTKVVLITGNPVEDDDELFQAIRSGASAYLSVESYKPQEFIATIERAARGEYPINDSVSNKPQIALRVLRQFEEIICNVSKEDDISTPLNPRETEILAHVVKGKANKEIGSILGISESAVKKQISSILRKLNANDRAHAAVLAVRSGIISIQPDGSISISNNDVPVATSDTIKEHSQILEDARHIRANMLSDAEEIARHIVEEAMHKGEEEAGRIIAEAVLEAERNASQIVEWAGKSRSQILADAEANAKRIIDEAEQNVENKASRILDEIVALAEQQASQIIDEAKRKAEVDSSTILNEGTQEVQCNIEAMKAQAEIEASRIITGAEQKAKQFVEDATNMAKSEASSIIVEAQKRAGQIIEDADKAKSKMIAEAEQTVKDLVEKNRQKAEDDSSKILAEAKQQADQIIEQAKQKCENNASRILTEVESKTNQIIETEGNRDQEITMNENGQCANLYDGVIELALAPPVHLSTLCELHKKLKQSPTLDVLSIKGSVTEGLKIRMLVKAPIAILEFIKGISAVKDASVDNSPVQTQNNEDVKRILVTTY